MSDEVFFEMFINVVFFFNCGSAAKTTISSEQSLADNKYLKFAGQQRSGHWQHCEILQTATAHTSTPIHSDNYIPTNARRNFEWSEIIISEIVFMFV